MPKHGPSRPSWLCLLAAALCSLALATATPASEPAPRRELLGLRLGMSDLEVRKRLERIGRLTETQPEASGRKQIWTVRDRRFQTLNLRFDAKHELQWCTAYARARRVRYTDVGDTTHARRAGHTIWIWAEAASPSGPAYQVTARGTHPTFCSSVALSLPTARPAESEPSAAPADSTR